MIIICVYRTPTSDVEILIENLDFILSNLINRFKYIIIVGDLNIDFLSNNANMHLKAVLNSYGLEAVINVPTRIGHNSKTAVDQIILNRRICNYTFSVVPMGFSDHFAQIMKIGLKLTGKSENIRTQASDQFMTVRSCQEENIQHLNFLLSKETWEQVFRQNNVNSAYNEFVQSFSYCHDIAMPKKQVKIKKYKTKLWVTNGIRVSSKRLRWLNKIIKNDNPTEELKQYYFQYKLIYKKVINQAKKIHNDKYINSSKNRSKAMWDLINTELGKGRAGPKNIKLNVDNVEIKSPQQVANKFNEFFANAAENLLSTNLPSYNNDILVKVNEKSMFLTPVTEEEVAEITKSLKNKKSTGIDEISDYVIKRCHLYIVQPLTHIINLSLSTGSFPDGLKDAKIKPIFKKGVESEIGNYRPVSLLSPFSKIFEKVMHKRLVSFLNDHKIIASSQHGFCKGKSTNTAITDFLTGTYNSVDKKEISIGLFLDLSKAFDLVDHNILLGKMEAIGIRGVANCWFKSYLSHREQRVEITYKNTVTNKIEQCLSERKPIKYGVPQGSVLGPILFLIYINDLENYIVKGKPIFFADDTSILIAGQDISTISVDISETMKKLIKWFDNNRLLINKEKTVALSFHHINNKTFFCPPININGNQINYKGETKFLGVWLDDTLKWFTHTEHLANKLSKLCFALLLIRRVSHLETTRVLYFSYFHSVISYGIIFWGNSPNSKFIFRLQKRAIRIMMQVPRITSCREYFKRLQILPLPCIYIYEILLFIKSNISNFTTNSDIHSYNTRNRNELSLQPINSTLCRNNFINTGLRIYNHLPKHLKEISALCKFKTAIFRFLTEFCFYSIDEYFELKLV